jgi:hypothetical protein
MSEGEKMIYAATYAAVYAICRDAGPAIQEAVKAVKAHRTAAVKDFPVETSTMYVAMAGFTR